VCQKIAIAVYDASTYTHRRFIRSQIAAGNGGDFYSRFGALHDLVPEASVEIADFGLGADATILLDYRSGPANPQVIHLDWAGHGISNHWVVMAPDFASFVDMLGL
jgi:hypothetical protein